MRRISPLAGAAPARLATLIGVRRRRDPPVRPAVRRWWLFAAIVNFAVTLPFLVVSVLHHLYGVSASVITWAHDDDPTRPWIFWIFLGFGSLWGVFFLCIRADPVRRRPWMKVAMLEKALATVAVWVDFVIFDNIGVALPLIVLFTDLAFVAVFAWTLHVTPSADDAATGDLAARVPVGSAPFARLLLRVVSIPTLVVALTVITASVVEAATTSDYCRTTASGPDAACDVLWTRNLWSLPPSMVWLWGGMAAILAGTMLWASVDVVLRRDIIGFGIFAHLIPAIAIVLGGRSEEAAWQPTDNFWWPVVGLELTAVFLLWLARRAAKASALALGADNLRPLDAASVRS